MTTAQERENRTLTQLAGMPLAPRAPGRMESYDISNHRRERTSLHRWSSMRAQSPRRAPTGDSRSRACRPTRTTTRPWRRCLRAHPALSGRGREIQPPADVISSSGGITTRGRRRASCVRRCTCTCRSSAWSRTTATRNARARHRAGPRDRPARRAERLRPDRSDPGGDASRFAITFHHESHSKSRLARRSTGFRASASARSGAAQDIQERQGDREADIFALERGAAERRRGVRLPSFSRGKRTKKRMKCNFHCDRPFDGEKRKRSAIFVTFCQQKSKNQLT